MKIGIYIGNSNPESGGAYTFQKDIIDSLNQYFALHEYFVFTDYAGSFDLDPRIKIVSIRKNIYQKVYYKILSLIISIRVKLFREKIQRKTHLMKLMRRNEIVIAWFMSSTFEDPGIPYIFTVWDLAHKYFPFLPEITTEGWKFEEREEFYSEAIAKAALIVTGTSLGKNDILNFYNIPSERVSVIPFPTPKYMLDFGENDIDSSFFDGFGDFIFYPAQFWPHKNHIIILLALKLLKQRFGKRIDVIFTGSDKGNLEYVKNQSAQLGIDDQVHFLGFVSRKQLVALYKHAKMLVFPTYFGPDNLPPLEAFAVGCPVVASNIPGANEQLGDNAILFNPNNEEDLANCIISVLDNTELKNNLVEKGLRRAKSWTSVNYTSSILKNVDELKSLIGLWTDVRSKKLRVLHINTFDTIGGASQVAYDLVHSMDVESVLVVMKKKSKSNKVIQLQENFLDKMFLAVDKVIWKLGYKKPVKNILGISDQFNFTLHKLKKLKEYQEADIIHLHNIHGNYFDSSALKKIASEKYIVWTLHDMWALTGGEAHTFENDNYKKGIGKTPYNNIYPLYSPFLDRRQHFIELKKRIYADIVDKLTLVPVSHWLENCLKSAYVYNKKMDIKLNYNGINTAIFKNYRKRNWNKPRLLFFNIDSPFKGSQLFLNILSRIKIDHDLTVVGEPLGMNIAYNHIQYTYNREYLNEIYNNTDFLVFPSLAESFGLTVLEALSCGVCVIASNIGGISEVLDNTSGYLFKSGDEEDLLDKINHALKNLAESRYMADIASGNVEKFSLKKNCIRYIEIYQQAENRENQKFKVEDFQQHEPQTKIYDFVKN